MSVKAASDDPSGTEKFALKEENLLAKSMSMEKF
jgi:hypothetical protein